MQKVEIVLLGVAGLLAVATANPQSLGDFITFKNGRFGVNFGGYHAEAGLGGLLGGGRTAGGLGASAGTPDGAHAEAGLGGLLDGGGFTGGKLHASAGLGHGNPEAAAGLGGELNGRGSLQGGLYAGATAGGAEAGVSKTIESSSHVSSSSSAAGFSESIIPATSNVGVHKSVDTYVSHFPPPPPPPNVFSKRVETHVYHPAPVATKTIQTETFAAPANVVAVEEKLKTRVTPKKQKTRVSTVVTSRFGPDVETGSVSNQKAVHPTANWNFQKYFQAQAQPVHYSNAFATGGASASAGIGGHVGAYGGGYGGARYGSSYGTGNYGQNLYFLKPQPNSQLFDDIFNIPISTLTAVNQLLRNKAGK
ncbi:uncharacterized protein LOC105690160 [Athalia rosae]|uniref:uncharacterized protein LOC105690160 n=1 Tax=Athalia rosae TaxID=37344 RepID=UPI0020334955|nr:uncharacterized protein LOC105690160 [Athalia rosae]